MTNASLFRKKNDECRRSRGGQSCPTVMGEVTPPPRSGGISEWVGGRALSNGNRQDLPWAGRGIPLSLFASIRGLQERVEFITLRGNFWSHCVRLVRGVYKFFLGVWGGVGRGPLSTLGIFLYHAPPSRRWEARRRASRRLGSCCRRFIRSGARVRRLERGRRGISRRMGDVPFRRGLVIGAKLVVLAGGVSFSFAFS